MKRNQYGINQVFTPTSQARENYIDRRNLDAHVYDALTTPGMQVVVFGESGAGKTTLLKRKLEEHYHTVITSRCTKDSTYETLILDAFDQAEATYVSEWTDAAQEQIKGTLSASIKVIRAGIEASYQQGDTTKAQRVVPPQLTPQKLAQILGEMDACWVLEDFHKVDGKTKTSIAQTLKLFSDMADDYPSVRLILVGAVATARQVVDYDPEMRYRIAEIEVPVLTDAELGSILTNGARLLNISMNRVADDVVRFSSGLGSLCHRLALDCCREAQVFETAKTRTEIQPEHLVAAERRYVETSSDTLRAIFEDAVERKRVRKFDNGRLILKALAEGDKSGMMHSEILAKIKQSEPEYRPSNLTNYLNRMKSGDSPILRQVGAYYRFSEPMYRAYAQFRFHEQSDATSPLRGPLAQWTASINEVFKLLEISWTNSELDRDPGKGN